MRKETFTTTNPATGEVLAELEVSTSQDIDDAVAQATEACAEWAALTGAERGRILRRAADVLRANNDALAQLEVRDTGKPIAEAGVVDVLSGADCLEFFGGVAAALYGEHVQLATGFAYTRREPLGVVAGLGAWNYPLQIACWKAAPALAAGNAMIFKPAEQTPLTAPKLAEALTEAGLPHGVFQVVQGPGSVGEMLSRHPGIRKVSLTGSATTGRRVMADAASTLKQVTMELGGKSPLIVFDDADLKNAVSGALLGNFYTQGEICSNGTRVFVQRKVLSGFLDELLPRVEKMRLGDPLDPSTDVGALISLEHLEAVHGFVKRARAEGATVRCGGQRVVDGELAKGAFYPPTVLTECRDDMEVVREEVFGPVMSVLVFDDEEDAVRRANDTAHGLAAGVFTRDLARGHRIAAALDVGTCWINTYNITPVEVPFGGVKASGLGRENGMAALEHYTHRKSVIVELGDVDAPY